jgi:hypothetical protein
MKNAISGIALLAALLCSGSAVAAEDKAKETFKKIEKGVGSLFEGIGQELKKVQKKVTSKSEGTKKEK